MKLRPSSTATVLVLLVPLALLVCGCASDDEGEQIEFHVPVSVRTIETGSVEDRVIVTGTVRAPEAVSLRADTSGVLRSWRDESGRRLVEGDRVEAGQLIAEITGEDVRIAARTEATRQRYEAAKVDYESKRQLYESGLMSAQEFRPVETELAEAKLEWERSRLTETRSRLVTPISGVVLNMIRDSRGLPMADGQLVAQGTEVAQIAPTERLIAEVDLLGPDLARVRPGMPARVRHNAWEEEFFDGTLERLAPSLDSTTRTLRADVAVDNPDGKLRPGMFVEVTLIAERREEVPVVPRDAVTERGGAKVVFVLNGMRVARREVVLGLGDDERVEVRKGVEVGERVVVRGMETLIDGTRVRVTGA
jgi:RND family efflux transporter MFP subunit